MLSQKHHKTLCNGGKAGASWMQAARLVPVGAGKSDVGAGEDGVEQNRRGAMCSGWANQVQEGGQDYQRAPYLMFHHRPDPLTWISTDCVPAVSLV